MKYMARLGWLVLVCLLSVGLPAAAQTQNYDGFYVLGDSLTDTGNDLVLTGLAGLVPTDPPSASPFRSYYNGRFSNGPNAFEHLWKLIKQNPALEIPAYMAVPNLQGRVRSFGFGGAATGYSNVVPPSNYAVPGVLSQVEMLRFALRGSRISNRTLIGLWAGANDYQLGLSQNPVQVVGNLSLAINRLYRMGARHFVVMNLPDLGLAPLVQAQGNDIATLMSQLSVAHNEILRQTVIGLNASLSGVKITYIDVQAFTLNYIATTPGLITYPPAMDVLAGPRDENLPPASFCDFVAPTTCPNLESLSTAPQNYLFWDAEHPTTEAYAALAQYVKVRLP